MASRRKAEELILAGRVTVDGRVATLGEKADPSVQRVEVDGRPLPLQPRIYVALNKPVGYTTTVRDPHAKHTVMELLRGLRSRVFPVGRLDVDTSGLLLLTNDGDLANRLMHPRYKVPKTYLARVSGAVTPSELRTLCSGILLDDGPAAALSARVLDVSRTPSRGCTTTSLVEIIIAEGRKRQVRRMFQALGHPVLELSRVAVGPIRLGQLKEGCWRYLTRREIRSLKDAVGG